MHNNFLRVWMSFSRHNYLSIVLIFMFGCSSVAIGFPAAQIDKPRLAEYVETLSAARDQNLKHPAATKTLLDSLLDIAVINSDEALTAYVQTYRGIYEIDHNQLETAKILLDRALELAQHNQMWILSAEIHRHLGKIETFLGNPGQALANYQLSLANAEKTTDYRNMGAAYSLIGNTYRVLGDYNKAIQFTIEAHDFYHQASFPEGAAWIAYTLGNIYSDLKLFDDALQYFQHSLEQYEALSVTDGDGLGIAICLDQIGAIHLKQGEYLKARESFSEAFGLYQTIENTFGIARSLRNLGMIELESGNPTKAISLLRSADSTISLKRDLTAKSRIYFYLGQALHKSGNHQGAIDTLHKTLSFANKTHQRQLEKNIYGELASIYTGQGNSKEAILYYKKQIALGDSLQYSTITENTKNLANVYEKEVRRKRIEELEIKNALHELRLEKEEQARTLFILGVLSLVVVLILVLILFRLQSRTLKERVSSEKRFRAMIKKLPFPAALMDKPDHFEYVNDTFTKVYGYRLEDLTNAKDWWTDVVPDPEFRSFIREIWSNDERSTQEDSFSRKLHQGRIRPKDGEPIYSEIYWVAIGEDRLVLLPDVTARVLAERSKAELQKQLFQSQKLESVGTMVGGIAHEFNNILQGIFLNIELAEPLLPDESKSKQNFEQIKKGSRRAKRIVDSILMFSRSRSIDFTVQQIQGIVMEAIDLKRSTLPPNVELKTDIDESAGAVMCDSTQIYQIVLNLCSNAVQGLGDKQGTINVSLKQVHTEPVLGDEPRELLELAVSDTGRGIEKDKLDKIFDPFFSTQVAGKGAGLGLSVVHGIVEMMGGNITATSQPDVLTTFTIRIPLASE